MRFAAIILLGLCAVAISSPSFDYNQYKSRYMPFRKADKQHCQRQKDILRLFKFVNQPSYYKDHVEIAKTYSIQNNMEHYSKPEVAKEFLYWHYRDSIPRDRIFSIFYEEHLKQAVALYKLFCYSKNYETFYKTAVWARNNVNQGLFLYSFSVAILHYPATYGIVLPPIYEIYPYYFYNSEVIQKARQYKQQHGGNEAHQQEGYTGYTVYGNYSGYYMNIHPEQAMSYYTEDVGINAYYYYYNLYHPFWLTDKVYMNTYKRGEEFYYFYQQILARYYLERLSNDMGEIHMYDYEGEFETGYYCSLAYPNGLAFPERPNWAEFGKNYYNYGQSYSYKSKYGYTYNVIGDYERRIRDAIDSGYIITDDGKFIHIYNQEGLNTLGNMMEANPESPNRRFYGCIEAVARHLLGYAKHPLQKNRLAPSALEHYETSLRDPAFYQFYKRMIYYFQRYKRNQPRYNKTDLEYPGVKVEHMEVDHLVTYFETVDAEITNAVYANYKEYDMDNYRMRVRQQRLNHKPFTYKIKIACEKPEEAMIRVFIGPKYDKYGRRIHIKDNRMNFVEFDTFKQHLQQGSNHVERNSRDIYFRGDYMSQREMYQWTNEDREYPVFGSEVRYTFPNRYLLPKGKHGGQTYQMYVMVSPYSPANDQYRQNQQREHQELYQKYGGGEQKFVHYYPTVGLGVPKIDAYPLGYPFDRPISFEHDFYVHNSYFHDVVVYHKSVNEINASVKPQEYYEPERDTEYFNKNYGNNHTYDYYHY